MAISEYLSEQRLKEAAYLLRGGSLPSNEISELLHFANQGCFGKKFKECFEKTPQAYRLLEGIE